MSTDQAYEFLVEHLAEVSKLSGQEAERWRQGHQQGDLHIPDAAWLFWKRTLGNALQSFSDLTEEQYVAFYDAAWELSRQGILRFGQYIPRGQSARTGGGDVYSITQYGRHWLLNAADRATISPFKMASLFQSFSPQFGDGFNQRATEAVSAYRAGNYLSACVMAGAAAESILLALAVAKSANEERVLKEYSTSGGRGRVTQTVKHGLSASLSRQLETSLQVLQYWRDSASHGTMTAISEIEAYSSMGQLLRLAQFASQHWTELTQ